MVNFLEKRQDVTWTSPSGKVFVLKTLVNEYTRKHIGEVKENPKQHTQPQAHQAQAKEET